MQPCHGRAMTSVYQPRAASRKARFTIPRARYVNRRAKKERRSDDLRLFSIGNDRRNGRYRGAKFPRPPRTRCLPARWRSGCRAGDSLRPASGRGRSDGSGDCRKACPANRQAPRPACRARRSGNVWYSSETHDPDFGLFDEDLAFAPVDLSDFPAVPDVSLDLVSLFVVVSLGLAAASSALAALL